MQIALIVLLASVEYNDGVFLETDSAETKGRVGRWRVIGS